MAAVKTVQKNNHSPHGISVSGDGHQPKVTAILQGRLGSSRLPGKVMLPLAGKPVMQHVYERILRCRSIERIIVATTTNPEDDAIVELFERLGCNVFRGSASDPLDRYYHAARHYGAPHVVRIMADCPLVDPQVVDAVIMHYFAGGYDFCFLGGEFPSGLDTTVFSYAALERSWKNARRLSEREHVTSYITNNPQKFSIGVCETFKGLYHLRWTMDHQVDYEFITAVYTALYAPGKIFLSKDVIRLLERQPHLVKINAEIVRDEGIRKSVEQERQAALLA